MEARYSRIILRDEEDGSSVPIVVLVGNDYEALIRAAETYIRETKELWEQLKALSPKALQKSKLLQAMLEKDPWSVYTHYHTGEVTLDGTGNYTDHMCNNVVSV